MCTVIKMRESDINLNTGKSEPDIHAHFVQ